MESLEPTGNERSDLSPVHSDFKNADTTYFRALSQYLDNRIIYI